MAKVYECKWATAQTTQQKKKKKKKTHNHNSNNNNGSNGSNGINTDRPIEKRSVLMVFVIIVVALFGS